MRDDHNYANCEWHGTCRECARVEAVVVLDPEVLLEKLKEVGL